MKIENEIIIKDGKINKYEVLIKKKEQSIINLSQIVKDKQRSKEGNDMKDNYNEIKNKDNKEVIQTHLGMDDEKMNELLKINSYLKENLKVIFKQLKIEGKQLIDKDKDKETNRECCIEKLEEINKLKIIINENKLTFMRRYSSTDENFIKVENEKEINDLKEELIVVKRENEFLEIIVRNLRERLISNQNNYLINSSNNIQELINENSEYSLTITNLEAKIKIDRESIEKYKEIINKLQMELADVNIKLTNYQNNDLLGKDDDLNDKLVLIKLEEKLIKSKKEKENFENQMETLKVKYEENLNKLKTKLQDMEKKYLIKVNLNNKLKKKDECWKLRLDKRKKQIDFLKNRYSEIKQHYKILEIEMENLRYNNTELKVD